MTGVEWARFVLAHWTYEERELIKQLVLTLTAARERRHGRP